MRFRRKTRVILKDGFGSKVTREVPTGHALEEAIADSVSGVKVK